MSRKVLWILLTIAGTLNGSLVEAQHKDGDPSGGGRRQIPALPGMGNPVSGLSLLALEQIQQELQLTDQQKFKLLALAADPKLARGNPEKQLTAVLNPEQLKRMKQLRLQLSGAAALLDPEVARTLKLNDQQRKKLKTLGHQAGEQMQEAIRTIKALPPEEQKTKAAEIREQLRKDAQEALNQAMEVLTPQQREKFEKLKGQQADLDVLQFMLPLP